MSRFALEIIDDEGSQCTIYTVRKEGATMSETEKFFAKQESTLSKYVREFQELTHLITTVIADEDGAKPEFFRPEGEADGLPPKGEWDFDSLSVSFINYPLRLYCLRISDDRLVLFNGDEKTSGEAKDGKTRTTFLEAQDFSKRIKSALKHDLIDFNEEEIIIY
jgi:hypothetical protein